MNKSIKYIFSLLIIALVSYIFLDNWVIVWAWLTAAVFLTLVMFVRPLKDIFPKVDLFQFWNEYRRYLGWIMAIFAVTHGVLKVIQFKWFTPNKSWLEIVNLPFVTDYTWFIFWWILSALVLLPIFLTSNSIAVQKLWKTWKYIQRLSYVLVFFVATHIALNPEVVWYIPLWLLILWIITWLTAYFKSKKKA